MFDVDEPISDYQKVVRERASQSLGPLRYAFNSPLKAPVSKRSPYGGDAYISSVTRLKTLLQRYEDAKIAEPRNPAFVSKASGMLDGQAFSPERGYFPDTSEVTHLLDNQFAILQHLEGQVEFYKDALESLKQRSQLVINENETLFDHLKTQAVTQVLATENETEFEDHLASNRKGNAKDDQTQRSTRREGDKDGGGDDDDDIDGDSVVDNLGTQGRGASSTEPEMQVRSRENTERKPRDKREVSKKYDPDNTDRSARDSFVRNENQTDLDPRKSLMPHVSYKPSFEDSLGMGAIDSQLFMSANERNFVNQLEEEVEKIRKLHEAKTKHLETLLYSTRDELEDSQRRVSELEAKLRTQKLLVDQTNQPAVCVKCGHQTALLSNSHSDAAIDTINKLTKERDDLMNTLTGQKAVLAEVRQREFEAYNQVKNSCHMVEQAQLEKAEAIIHVRQLREDLKKERDRHDQYMKLSSEKMEKEREKIREACLVDSNAISKQLEATSEARAALEIRLERLTREKVDLATELEQAKNQILAHASEIAQAGGNVQQELEQTRMKLSTASQELNSLKTTAQQSQREREQERTRTASEMDGLRRRLQDAEKGWMESKEDCIRLTERLNLAEREAKSAVAAKEKLEKTSTEEMETLSKQNKQREGQLTSLLEETETRNTQCRTELQQMVEAEIQVCNRLKEECKKLTQQLHDSSEKARSRLQEANQECTRIRQKLEESMAERRTLKEQNTKKEKRIHELSARLKHSDESSKKQVDQMCQLLATRNNLMKERKILCQEVEFLRKQWMPKTTSAPATPVDTASHASAEDDEQNVRDA